MRAGQTNGRAGHVQSVSKRTIKKSFLLHLHVAYLKGASAEVYIPVLLLPI